MFRFYYRAHELEIQRAAENDDWKKVTELYEIDPSKSKNALDDSICTGVINALISSSSNLDSLASDLLRALTFTRTFSIYTTNELLTRLRALPYLSELEKSSRFITTLTSKSADIFTVMLEKQYNYDQALTYVNQGKEIPFAEAAKSAISKLTPAQQ